MSLIVSWHPTYAFYRNPYEWGAFKIDLDRFARVIKGHRLPDASFILKRPREKHIKRLHAWALMTGEPISVDIETSPEDRDRPWTGKDPTRAKLQLLGLGSKFGGMSIDWRKATSGIKRAAKKLLEDEEVLKDGQNFDWFDQRVLNRYGVHVAPVFDTRDARRALSSTSPLSLGYMTSLYYDAHPWKEKEDGQEKGALWQKPEYNAYDCFYTSHVAHGIRSEPEWNTPRVQGLYTMHRSLSAIAAEMHTTGIWVNETQRQWMSWALAQEFQEKAAKLLAAVNIDGFEPNPNHLRALIFRKHARGKNAHLARFNLPDPINPAMYVDPKEPDTISVDEDALTLLLIDPDIPQDLKVIIDLWWDAMSIQKQRSTFVDSELILHAIGADGRLRPGWNTCGTDTGRWSCSEPNVMTPPQLLRAFYESPLGYRMIGADWSQLELRVMAAVAQDRALIKALETGDVYSFDAKAWFGLPQDMDVKKLKPDARKSAKIIHLASQYAAGTKTVFQQGLKQDRKLKYDLVQGLHNGFKRTYSDTVRYWEEELKRVCETGYSETRIMQRRRYYPTEPPITETSNFPIQGTAGDIANQTIIRIHSRLKRHVPKSKLVIQLHDAFYLYARERDERVTVEIVKEEMERPVRIEGRTYVFPTEIKVGTRMSDL